MKNIDGFVERAVAESLELKKKFFADNQDGMHKFYEILRMALADKRQVLIFGNGGSAADAQHFAAELMHRVEGKSIGMRALALHTDTSLLTALSNDKGFDEAYARQIDVLAAAGDVAVAISTSGKSSNIVKALQIARRKECRTVGLLGRDGGAALQFCELALIVPHQSTPRIQEVHGMIIHLVCQMLELED